MVKEFKPKLRFSEFEDNWSKEKISNLGIKVIDGDRGKNYPNGKDFTEEGFCLFLNAKNVTKKGFAFDDTSFISKEKDELLRKGKLKRNDIILTTRGSVGHIAFYDTNITYDHIRINSGMVLLRNEKKSIIDNRYFYKYLNSLQLKRYILKVAFGSAQPQLTVKEIYNFSLSFPNLPEQQKIASFLSDVDAKITQLTKKKDLLEQYKKGIMQKIFSQELRFKDDNGNAFPKWEEKKLGDVFTFKQGFQFGVEEQSETYFKGSVEFIRIINVTSDKNDKRYVLDPGKEHHINKEDLFMVRYGDAGRVANGFTGIIANNMFRLLPHFEINKLFFFYSLGMLYKKIHALSGSSTMPAISFSTINKLKIIVPSITEQKKIANFLSEIDVKIEALNTKIENSKAFKKGLLQQMFV